MTRRNLEEELALVHEMPMSFNALVIEYTSRCNAKCAMCYQAAGPQGSDLIGKATLDVQTAERVIREAIEIETVAPRCHITGGEGFLNAGTLLHLVGVARDVGFADVTTTTNGFWARDLAHGVAMAARARKAGMTSMEISWDYWHEPYISADAVSNSLEACCDAGIEANLRILSSRSHSYADALRGLRPDVLELVGRITCAPVMPTGRGATEVPPGDVYAQGTLDDSCHGMLNLTVNARGSVSPCCSGLDQIAEQLFGNVTERPLREIVEALDRSLLARVLVFRGVGALATMIEETGVRVDGRYTSICHQCWSMFSDTTMILALEDALQRRRELGLQRALDGMRQHVVTA